MFLRGTLLLRVGDNVKAGARRSYGPDPEKLAARSRTGPRPGLVLVTLKPFLITDSNLSDVDWALDGWSENHAGVLDSLFYELKKTFAKED